jgi:hypothetical protein
MITLNASKSSYVVLGGIPIISGTILISISLINISKYFQNQSLPSDFKIVLGLGLICLLIGVFVVLRILPNMHIRFDDNGFYTSPKAKLIPWDCIREFRHEIGVPFVGDVLYADFKGVTMKVLVLNNSFTDREKATKYIINHISDKIIDRKILKKYR